MAASITALLLSSYFAFVQAAPPPASPALQFVIADRALKSHAIVAKNELTITGGAKEPYLSSATVTDFEIAGEVRFDGEADAALLLYAWEREISSAPPVFRCAWRTLRDSENFPGRARTRPRIRKSWRRFWRRPATGSGYACRVWDDTFVPGLPAAYWRTERCRPRSMAGLGSR
jgi:hypothetical protein